MAKKDVVKSVCIRIYEDEIELIEILQKLKGSETIPAYIKKAILYYEGHGTHDSSCSPSVTDNETVGVLKQMSENMERMHENIDKLCDKIANLNIVVATEENDKNNNVSQDVANKTESANKTGVKNEWNEQPLEENEIGISTNTDESIPEEIMGDFMSFLQD